MSESTTLQRPRQVTTASILGGVGSLMLLVSLFDLMGRLRSIEVRERVAENLESPAYAGLGVDAAFVTEALRVLLLLSGACAAAAVVCAVYAFQRHGGARIGFAVSSALLFVTTFLMADWIPGVPFGVAVVTAFAASMLWSPPVRDWYAGRAPAPQPERARDTGRTGQTAGQGPGQSPGAQHAARAAAWAPPSVPQRHPDPRPHDGDEGEAPVGDPSGAGQPAPPPASYPFGQQRPADAPAPWTAPSAAGPGVRDERPMQVTAAVVLTWIVSASVALTFGLVVLMLLVARETLLGALRTAPELASSGLTTAQLMAALWVTSAVLLFWCLVACVLAVLAFRRQGWARGVLVASAVMATLVSLLTFPIGLLVAIPAAAVAGLLLSAPARAWYAAAGAGSRGPGGGAPGAGPGPAGPPPPSYPQQPPQPPQPQGKPPVW